MMEYVGKIKAWAVLLLSALTVQFSALALPFGLLVLCNVIDYVTGLWAAPRRGQQRSSNTGLSGITKKVCSWLLVLVGMVCDALLHYLTDILGWEMPLVFAVAALVCVWLLANEILSILENIGDITGRVPPFLKPLIDWVKQQAEKRDM